jgi:hypothetical protein
MKKNCKEFYSFLSSDDEMEMACISGSETKKEHTCKSSIVVKRCQMKRYSKYVRLVVSLLLVPLTASLTEAQSLSKGKGDLRVMTYNANEGTDYKEVMAAHTQLEFLLAVGATITQVRFTEPAARMQALAKQIIATNADLVSLQELDQWSTGSFNPTTGQCGAVGVEFDMLPALMNALEAQGAQ